MPLHRVPDKTPSTRRNGPVWSRLFAERHNFELRSFAVGGATTDNDFIQGTLVSTTVLHFVLWYIHTAKTSFPSLQGTDDSIPVPSVKVQVTQSLTKNVPRTLDLYAIVIGSNDFLQSDTPVSGTDVANLVEKRVSQLYKAGTLLWANGATTPCPSLTPFHFLSHPCRRKTSSSSFTTRLQHRTLRAKSASRGETLDHPIHGRPASRPFECCQKMESSHTHRNGRHIRCL